MNKYIFLAILALLTNLSWSQLEWVHTTGGGSNVSNAYGNSTTDSLGNTYNIGHFRSTINLDPNGSQMYYANNNWDVYVQKFDSNGDLIWARVIGGMSDDKAGDVSVDLLGNVFISGSFEDTTDLDPSIDTFNVISNGQTDIFIVKLTSDGDFVWGKSIGTPNSELTGVNELKPSGNYCLSGEYNDVYIDLDPGPLTSAQSASGTKGSFVVELTPNGDYVSGLALGTSDGLRLNGVSATQDNGLCLIGEFQGAVDMDPGPGNNYVSAPINATNAFIVRVDSVGNMEWYKSIEGSATSNVVKGKKIKVAESGSIYAYGTYGDTLSLNGVVSLTSSYVGGHGYIVKYTPDGLVSWARTIDSRYLLATCLTVDGDALLFSGGFRELIDLDPTNAVLEYTGGIWEENGFIASYDTLNGQHIWSEVFEAELNGYIHFVNLKVDNQNALHAAGRYFKDIDFDPSPGSTVLWSPQPGGFNVKFNSTLNVSIQEEPFNFRVYPNPTSGQMKIALDQMGMLYLTIFDKLGRIVYQKNQIANNNTSMINISELAKGVYFMKLCIGDKSATQKIIIN